jgi:tRNA(Ile)-lysidine synthase
MTCAAALAALIDGSASARFAVAVSGGGDSMALLRMMHDDFAERITALTVDHQLRQESAGEAAQVAMWCAALNIPHHILRWQHDGGVQGNVQEQARIARYALMQGWCETNKVHYLVTAHTMDDMAETLLMRLARGAGLRGLSAMAGKRILSDHVTLLRPLLHLRHNALLDYLRKAGQPWVEDPSNQDRRYDRVKARTLLADPPLPGLTAERIATSAQALASADSALHWAARRCWDEQTTNVAGVVTFRSREGFLALPADIRRRLLLEAMEQARSRRPHPPRQGEIERLLAAIAQPDWRGATLGGCHFSPRGAEEMIVTAEKT